MKQIISTPNAPAAIGAYSQAVVVNNLVYALASPNRIGDTSWIKPGKVAWDWWNNCNVTGVETT